MTKTTDNLKAAFSGESQANRKYLAFAAKADKEGHPQTAKLFRAAAHAETIHAHAHLRAMKGIGSTAENLKEAIEGEVYEFESMYPPMIEQAKEDGDKAALRSFEFANVVEKTHAELYKKALDTIDNPADVDYWVCSVCGHTTESEPEGPCPVCKAKAAAFCKID